MKEPPDLPEAVGAVCPYCKQNLSKRPKRKTKCPHCGEYVFVRTSPSGNGSKVLVTDDEAEQIDLEWQRIHSRKKWMQSLAQYGISDADFDRHKKSLGERFRQEPRDSDVVWSLFHEALDASMKSGDLRELKMLYFEMALFAYEEGRDFFHLLEQSRKMELTEFKKGGYVEKVSIITAGDASCEACQKLAGRVFTVDEALEQMPIPCEDCTFDFRGRGQPGWCRCLYGAVVD
jgi:hypothetical protein